MRKLKLTLMIGTILTAWNVQAACVTPPDCAELGFTTDASKCSGTVLKCPWDLTKAACSETSGGTPEMPILYGDGTVSKEIISGKNPIGVVFDEANKLALALTDVNREGKETSAVEQWSKVVSNAGTICAYRSVASCDFASQTPATCGADGQNNTTKILNDPQIVTNFYGNDTICKNVAYAALGCYNYEPSKCEKDFCKKTKWFLPSMRDLAMISNLKAKIKATIEPLTMGYGRIKEEIYCSSNKADEYDIWTFDMKNTVYSKDSVGGSCVVRPVVKY